MNIVIGIAILFTLMLSDSKLVHQQSVTESLIICAWTIAFILIPPLVAAIQVLGIQKNPYVEPKIVRRHVAVHSGIWFASSLGIAWILQWPNVVRFDLGLDGWILIDELLILCPLLISLICSWWIQSDYQSGSRSNSTESAVELRRRFVAIRCQVYLAFILIPVLLLLLIKDLWPYLSAISPALATTSAVLAFAMLMCFMPWFVSLMWNNRSIAENEGRLDLIRHCQENHLRIKDIRIWDTGNQIINALVAGIIPRFRVLMLSDLLLSSFPTHELKAVLRHEAGHIRMCHLPIRIGFILLPALAMIAIEMDTNHTLEHILTAYLPPDIQPLATSGILGLLFVAYILFTTAWLSRNMEFEADLFAVGAFSTASSKVDTESAQSMADALLRFAEQNPDQYFRRSFTHPSLIERIEVIKDYIHYPDSAGQFRTRFVCLQATIAVSIVLITLALILV